MSDANKDDWAMTQLNIRRPSESVEENFDKTSPNFDPSEVSEFVDWHVKPMPQKPQQPSDDFDKTFITTNKSTNNDWDVTQANIKIPKNEVVNFKVKNERQEEWGMTTPHIDKGYIDMDFSAVAPPRSDSIAMPGSGMTQVGSPVEKKIKLPNFPVAEVSTQKKEISSVNKWLYFMAGAFTMFAFMVVFLAAVYLIIFFK
jgi:hypothetical protein